MPIKLPPELEAALAECEGGQAFTLRSTEEMDARYAYLAAMEGRPTRFALGGHVEYRPGSGSWPVVLCAPHGGTAAPADLPDTGGCHETDERTYELADACHAAFSAYTRGSVALVALTLHRRKCDANRSRSASGHGDAWAAYHAFVEEAVAEAVRAHDFCLVIDLHGQGHRPGVTECGYLLTAADYLQSDDEMNAKPPRPSSMDAIARRGPKPSLSRLVRGRGSLGGRLALARHEFVPETPETPDGLVGVSFACTPSPERPRPVDEADLMGGLAVAPGETKTPPAYFHGGYTARRYGAPTTVPPDADPLSAADLADWGNAVAAVQLECAWHGVRDCPSNRAKFGKKLREDVRTFLWEMCAWIYKAPFHWDLPDPSLDDPPPPPPLVDFELKSYLDPAYDYPLGPDKVPIPKVGEKMWTAQTDWPKGAHAEHPSSK